jgi:hypothetical protein
MSPSEAEIVVRKAGSYVLWIYANSNDARAIIEHHAPRFGNLYPPRKEHYDLYVSEEYETDLDQVIAYLQSLT